MIRISLYLIFFTYVLPAFAQSPVVLLDQYISSHHIEKLYIGHDKPFYITGETVWCKLYLLDGRSHQTLPTQPIVYVDWIAPNGTILKTYYLKIQAGTAELDIQIPKDAIAGNYTIRAYTLYQKNFEVVYLFQKEILVADFYKQKEESKAEGSKNVVQFFPEGGDLVQGISSKVAFKIQDEQGNNMLAEGQILDEHGQLIAPLKTLHEGMGFFHLKPLANTKYYAHLTILNKKETFDLPISLSDGYGLGFEARFNEFLKINLQASSKKSLKNCLLIGHLRGKIFLNKTLEDQDKLMLSLAKEELPTGLLHFTLFDAKKRPVAERLIFNKNDREKVAVALKLDPVIREANTIIKGEIKTLKKAKTVAANLSISIYNNDLISSDFQGISLENYLLLQSDIKGKIRNINQYFEKEDASTRSLLDLVLMTHGWRRFTWQQILDKGRPDLIYPVEETFSFSGQVRKEAKKKRVKADVFLNVLSESNFQFNTLTTGEEGLFFFDGFTFTDTTDLLIQANIFNKKKKEKKLQNGQYKRVGNKYVDVEIFHLQELPFNADWSIKPFNKKKKAIEKYVEKIAKLSGEAIIDSSLWTINLDEVTVTKKRLSYRQQRYEDVRRKYREKGIFHFGNTEKFFAEDLFEHSPSFIDIFDLITSAIPGTYALGPMGDRKLFSNPIGAHSGQGEITLALDGSIVSSRYLNSLPPEAVDVMDMIAGLRADALYGVPLVINILMKEGIDLDLAMSKAQNIGMKQIVHPGFYQAKTFYQAADVRENNQTAIPSTLYWNPNLSTMDTGATFEFQTKAKGNFQVIIEGISQDGIPFMVKDILRL